MYERFHVQYFIRQTMAYIKWFNPVPKCVTAYIPLYIIKNWNEVNMKKYFKNTKQWRMILVSSRTVNLSMVFES